MHRDILAAVTIFSLIVFASPLAAAPSVCGTGEHASVCFASIDERGKLDADELDLLRRAGTGAIDTLFSDAFASELARIASDPGDGPHKHYWQGFDVESAIANTRSAFNGLHVETYGGFWGLLIGEFADNLAKEGKVRADGTRQIELNRTRLNRSAASIAATYVHEAAHQAGYSHRKAHDKNQICEPPYVMGQIVWKIMDEGGFQSAKADGFVCRLYW